MTTQIPANVRTVAQAVAIGLLHDETTGNTQIPRDTIQAVIAATLDAAWPTIEAHIREQVAREIENNPGPINGEWMDSRDRIAAASIARNGAPE